MVSPKKLKMNESLAETFLVEHISPRSGFAVSAKVAYETFLVWAAGAVHLTFKEFVSAVRGAGVAVRSKGFGPLLLGRAWTPAAHSLAEGLRLYRVPSDIVSERKEAWRQRQKYTSQTEIGKTLGLTRNQVGKLLMAAGLKDPVTLAPTTSAMTDGVAVLAKSYPTRAFYLWHRDVMTILRQLRETMTPSPMSTMPSPGPRRTEGRDLHHGV